MKNFSRAFWCPLGLATAALLAGCSKDPEPPAPVAVEEAPASLQEVFKEDPKTPQQDPQVQLLVNDAVSALQEKNYPKALFALEALSGRSDLTYGQRDFVTRSMLAVHQAVAAQASSGDARAQQALDFRRANK